MVSAETAGRFLAGPALALVGVSQSGKKFGNLALKTLRAKGYRVYPVHPSASSIDGVACRHRLADVPEAVSAVIVVVPPLRALDVIREAHAGGMQRVWLQQGSESPEALTLCRALGLEVVAGECVLMFANPTSYHWVHATLRKLFSAGRVRPSPRTVLQDMQS
jgi:predicted CoA-binding protein